jgi:hypothetical protein
MLERLAKEREKLEKVAEIDRATARESIRKTRNTMMPGAPWSVSHSGQADHSRLTISGQHSPSNFGLQYAKTRERSERIRNTEQ